jgi:hypothetical protein
MHESGGSTTDARADPVSVWVPKQYLPPTVVPFLLGELVPMQQFSPEHIAQPSKSDLPPLTDQFQSNSSSTLFPQVNHWSGIQDLRKDLKQTCPTSESMLHHQEVSQSSLVAKLLSTSQTSRVLRVLDTIDLTGPDLDCDSNLYATGSTHLKWKHGLAFQNQDEPEVIDISD